MLRWINVKADDLVARGKAVPVLDKEWHGILEKEQMKKKKKKPFPIIYDPTAFRNPLFLFLSLENKYIWKKIDFQVLRQTRLKP